MSNNFPPSSPVKWYQSDHISSKNNKISEDKSNLLSDDHKQIITNDHRTHSDRYPTPNPSSSIGIFIPSSPVSSSFVTKDINTNKNNTTTTNKHYTRQLLSDFSPTEHFNIKTHPNTINSINTTTCDTIPIFLSPNTSQHYILGRKSSICDIKLPHHKNISRQHAIVSYNDKNKILNINCLGHNSMIISFQSRTDYSLESVEPKDNKLNEKSIGKMYKIASHIQNNNKISNRLLKRHNNLISFSLLKNEIVQLPLIDNIILDFRKCKCVIKLCQDDCHDTDTEDEFALFPTKSDDFVCTPTKHLVPIYPNLDNSPTTEKSSHINEKGSPSMLLKTPSPKQPPSSRQQHLPYNDTLNQQLPQTPIKKKYKFDTDVYNNIRRLNNVESPIKKFSKTIDDNISLSSILKSETLAETTAEKKSFKLENHTIPKPIESVNITSNIDKGYEFKVELPKSFHNNINNISVENETYPFEQDSTNKHKPSSNKGISVFEWSPNIEKNDNTKYSVTEDLIQHGSKNMDKLTREPHLDQYERNNKISERYHLSSLVSEKSHLEVKDESTSKKRKLNTQLNIHKNTGITQTLNKKDINLQDVSRIIVNQIAFSNLKQTPLSHIMNINGTTRSLTKDKIKSLLRDIPCIGEIKRYGKDAAGNLLEADYYYDLENDDDKERRSVLISLKGGKNLGLRSCRKTHKQYYWKKPSKR
ncbi:hypothetical protein RI543_004451 [Arxiozyma heterogenica]|uniref:FHA domain-containing protein n=1 Tax=Arxiozyma heterogenica TaxID=278026 RepID=A0AAN7ZRJ4_9SACH|nr:hypothetical protein RI543_004451 [Kazachstania heterogenica]